MASMLSKKANPAGAEKAAAQQAARQAAILKRYRELLLAQGDRFRDYLNTLDQQQTVIEKGDAPAILSHMELEEQLVADIFTIQKSLDPMEDLYRAATPDATATLSEPAPENVDGEIPKLKAALEELKREAAARSERNKDLLSRRMAEIKGEIKELRGNPYAARPSIYSGAGPSMIDLKG